MLERDNTAADDTPGRPVNGRLTADRPFLNRVDRVIRSVHRGGYPRVLAHSQLHRSERSKRISAMRGGRRRLHRFADVRDTEGFIPIPVERWHLLR